MKTNQELIEHLKSVGILKTPEIISAFEKADRVDFIKLRDKSIAYEDIPLDIGYDQTISQPLTVAFMLEELEPNKGDSVLDIGSGSGWTAALLAYIVGENGKVAGLEIIPELVDFGLSNIQKYKLDHVKIEEAERGVLGKPGQKFDRILVSASARKLPEELILQLKPNGTLVMPVGNSIFKITKSLEGVVSMQEFPGFVFVPLL
ncbi:protein-L-isoaspartate O-methyltransferase [Patescibacteria group bacterium]|nr:protein-L-isoaspartate O-methyltransferase [Patescibacteria group bacterium]MBU1953331.1 protein-L-isoaspartate O-methyltransferase [Patescibacteria group bacterium]